MAEKIVMIAGHKISNFGKPFVIAEIGSNHNGELPLAKQLIDKAIACGADAVKFQAFDTSLFSEACYEGDERRQKLMAESPALTRYFTQVHPELKREMKAYMTPKEMFREIKQYCDEKGIIFFCTPLDKKSVDFCVDELNMPMIKVASMDLNNYPFLDYLARKGKPLILSTGMSTFSEIVQAVETITKAGNDQLVILHCVSLYPPKDEIIQLNNLDLLRRVFPFPIGYSDHSFGFSVPLAAIAKGACMIEKHFTVDKNLPGWDHKVSATPFELMTIVEEGNKIHRALGSGERVVSQEELDKRHLFRRSVVITRNLKQGEVIQESDLDLRRPGLGLEPKDLQYVVGRTVKRDMNSDDLVRWDDLL